MIEARNFIDAARAHGIDFYSGVPCSFLTAFINYVIDAPQLRYIGAANEGDAVAIAAGAAIGGRGSAALMQNSGLGNAVSPLTSLTWVFEIPLLVICTHRGAPGLHDEPQHELMGRITERMFETMEIPWAAFPRSAAEVGPALAVAAQTLTRTRRPYAFVLAKDSVAAYSLSVRPVPVRREPAVRREFGSVATPRVTRAEALARVLESGAGPNTVVIATTGYTGRELYALADRPNHLYVVGSMGCASTLGLGLACARPDLRIVVVDGDGAALMRMGNLATIGAHGPANLVHLVLDNEVHESTGGQATVSAHVDFAGIAQACGYGCAHAGSSLELIDALLDPQPTSGARFGHLKIRAGTRKDLPRPAMTPPQVLARLRAHIGAPPP